MKRLMVLLCTILLSVNITIIPLASGELENDLDGVTRGDRDERETGNSYFFDFGDRSSPLMNGYTSINPLDSYSEDKGFGLLTTPDSYFVNGRRLPEYNPYVLPRSWVYGEYANNLTVDGFRSQENVTFRVDLPNGTYMVRTWIGDLQNPVYSMNLSYNGDWLKEGADAFHTVHRSMYFSDPNKRDYQNYGCAFPYTQEITIDNGTLVLCIAGNDTGFQQDLEAELAKNPPFSYLAWMSQGYRKYSQGTGPWRYIGGEFSNASVLGLEIFPVSDLPVTGDPGSLVLDPSISTQDLSNAVDAINSGDWELAYDQWNSSVNIELEGTALLARAQIGLFIAGTLKTDHELDVLEETKNDLESVLLQDRQNKSVQDLLSEAREFSNALDYYFERGISGPGAREQKNHFYEAGKAINHLRRIEPSSPLYPKARLWCARALFSLDPHRWTSASGTAIDIMESIRWMDPENPYISFYLDTNPDDQKIWENGTPILSTIGEEDSWFLENYSAGFENAPEWAKIVREELSWLYDITDWWVDHKQQPDGSIGGGWTDDVEMIGLFGFDALISQGANEKSLEGARKFVDGMLISGQVDMEKGFSDAFADTEHSAELTGDSLPMMVAIDFGNPYWIELAMKTAVLMRDLWMGENDNGDLQFKANHLSATRVGTGGQAEDSWINFRAALPAFWVWWYNRDPEIGELFVRWADTWVNASLSTEKGKPEGVIPAMIGWPTGEIGGINSPNWYQGKSGDGSVNYDWDRQQYKEYITSLLITAYETTLDQKFLEPMRLESELASDYIQKREGEGDSEPTVGSSDWAGMTLGQKAIDRYQDILDRFELPGGVEEDVLWTEESVISSCTKGYDYINKCYPLMTTEASATDRVAFSGIINPFLIYTGGTLGGALLSPAFTYTGLGRDFAAMVQKAGMNESYLRLYGFYEGDRKAGLVPWALEPGATYRMKIGIDLDGNLEPDTILEEQTFTFSSRGMEQPFTLPGGQEIAISLERTGRGSGIAPLPDPAWGEEEPIVDREEGTVLVAVHNLGPEFAGDVNVSLMAIDGNGTKRIIAQGKGDVDGLKGISPSITWITLQIENIPMDEEKLTLIIDKNGTIQQITTRNDERSISLDLSEVKVNKNQTHEGNDKENEAEDENDEEETNQALFGLLTGSLVILIALLITINRWYPDIRSSGIKNK